MKLRTLEQWLDYQQHVHPHAIDLGLGRVREVWHRLGSPQARCNFIIGGTNGKGSTVAFLEAMLCAEGYRVGAYTSPHLLAYNERVRIDRVEVDDASLCASFERIEHARGEIALTFFEFGTLAALDLFARAAVDMALLEVGLGGRLDASNIIDADVAIITTVDLDHQRWLGSDRDSIGAEKACIARSGRPVIVAEVDPPEGLLAALRRIGSRVVRNGIDYHISDDAADCWVWRHQGGVHRVLPRPVTDTSAQINNAAAAVAALHALDEVIPCTPPALVEGLRATPVRGRLQRLPGAPELIIDVAHNPQAARVLAQWLDHHPVDGPVHAVFGALDDKDVAGIAAALGDRIVYWHLAGLSTETPRGLPAQALALALPQSFVHDLSDDVTAALYSARAATPKRIVAFGSFFLVAALLRSLDDERMVAP